MRADPIDVLVQLYNQTSKHSNYQVLPAHLARLINPAHISVVSRHEYERWNYILANCCFVDRTVMDVGGNTGFFTFEALEAGARKILYYEGNRNHADFVEQAAHVLKVDPTISVNKNYIDFSEGLGVKNVDILFLLNVLHHVGDDYGAEGMAQKDAMAEIEKTLRKISAQAKCMVFQMGFNWMGNKQRPFFDRGTKLEMIEFIRSATNGYWRIVSIGVAHRENGHIKYSDISLLNQGRDDSLGEFLNRPIFIMKSTIKPD